MKKLILMAVAIVFGTAVMSAQDMSKATETYNAGAEALQIGSNETALKKFEEALALAEACGAEGADIVSNCKTIIPQIQLSVAKDLYNAKDFAAALAQVEVAIAAAEKYENADVATEAKDLKPQIWMQEGNAALNKKEFAVAVEKYQLVAAADTANGQAFLRLGQALNASGKVAEAEAAFNSAATKGQEKAAKKQLSNMYVKLASADLKAKKYDNAIANALKANEFEKNATAMKIAGTAASSAKKTDLAIEYLKTYLELSPKAKDANQMYYTIGALAQTKGDNATAIEYYEKVVNDPKFGPAVKPLLETLKK